MFCYDDQHRLTWAGSAGTPNCGTSLTPGSLTAASYTQTYSYDTLDRLQSGPLGSYTYGDSAHLHAVTSIANGGTTAYSASYDAGGNMSCRAATSSTTCAGTPTGAHLTFDNEGRLSAWQNTPTSPTTTDDFLYDGAGNRVEQQTTTNGSIITSTVYVAGGLEEITSTGASTTLTKYFGAQGLPTAERAGTNGPLAYLATDGQGTVSETLDSSGNVTSAQLYTPYGSARYSSGSSPTSMGYTGQRADSATGLDYYHARYYDPVAGQFVSADTVQDGLNRYGYVADNPTTDTDPTGHRLWAGGDSGGGGSCENCDTDDDGIHIRHHECPDPGCAYANNQRAVVGQGQRQQRSSDTNPLVYNWGSKQNGAIAYGYSGKSLQNLIQLMKYLRDPLQAFLDEDETAGMPLIDVVSLFLAFLYAWHTGNIPDVEELSQMANEGGTTLEQLTALFITKKVEDMDNSIAALEGAAAKGQTVWYVQMWWHGQTAPRYSQSIGYTNFFTGWDDQPPAEVLQAIGENMRAQCADFPSSPWGNSPGVLASQDSTYTSPCM